jgi:hypothetical protein
MKCPLAKLAGSGGAGGSRKDRPRRPPQKRLGIAHPPVIQAILVPAPLGNPGGVGGSAANYSVECLANGADGYNHTRGVCWLPSLFWQCGDTPHL